MKLTFYWNKIIKTYKYIKHVGCEMISDMQKVKWMGWIGKAGALEFYI